MRERQSRFEELMKRPQGVLANNVIDLEDRIRELKDAMLAAAMKFEEIVKR